MVDQRGRRVESLVVMVGALVERVEELVGCLFVVVVMVGALVEWAEVVMDYLCGSDFLCLSVVWLHPV